MIGRLTGRTAAGRAMSPPGIDRARVLRAGITSLTALEAIAFFAASGLHLRLLALPGADEPAILPAAIVHGVCGSLLALAALLSFTRYPHAWGAVMGAHFVSLFGVLIGTAAVATRLGPETLANTIFHRAMLLILLVVLAAAWSHSAQWAFGRR